jgi:hypothetical protein
MQLNVLRLDVATAAAEAEQQLRPTNRNAVAAFSPALADAVGLRAGPLKPNITGRSTP